MLLPYLENGRLEAGCDEAGRGCLAGAVYAAAVILPPDFKCEALNDSKQLSEKKRYELRPLIEREALAWAVGVHLAGLVPGDASGDRPAQDPSGASVDRRKPFHALRGHSAYDNRQG